jgi:iron complex transport system ATP-binding protein
MTTLIARGLTVSAGPRRLLDDVTLSLAGGEVVVVVGENGAGKSTLLDCLAGVRRPTLGEVRLDEESVFGLSPRERARRLASLGQANVLADDLSAAARIAQGLVPRRGPQALLDGRAFDAVRAVAGELGVGDVLGRRISTLSGGERRRVEVARALVDDEADAYLLDEPHAGVDARHASLVSHALRARARRGALVVATVHDLGVALSGADRVIGLREGRVVVDEPAASALTREHLLSLYGVPGEIVVSASGQRGVVLATGSGLQASGYGDELP